MPKGKKRRTKVAAQLHIRAWFRKSFEAVPKDGNLNTVAISNSFEFCASSQDTRLWGTNPNVAVPASWKPRPEGAGIFGGR